MYGAEARVYDLGDRALGSRVFFTLNSFSDFSVHHPREGLRFRAYGLGQLRI